MGNETVITLGTQTPTAACPPPLFLRHTNSWLHTQYFVHFNQCILAYLLFTIVLQYWYANYRAEKITSEANKQPPHTAVSNLPLLHTHRRGLRCPAPTSEGKPCTARRPAMLVGGGISPAKGAPRRTPPAQHRTTGQNTVRQLAGVCIRKSNPCLLSAVDYHGVSVNKQPLVPGLHPRVTTTPRCGATRNDHKEHADARSDAIALLLDSFVDDSRCFRS